MPTGEFAPQVDASIFDSALSHTRPFDPSEKRKENTRVNFGAISPVDKSSLVSVYAANCYSVLNVGQMKTVRCK